MSGHIAQRESSELDYETIQHAVMETERGRWFLSEFARRNRHADTEMLLASMVRIERSISMQREPTEIDKFRLDVLEMSRAISRTRTEISAIRSADANGPIIEASGELDSVVSATESATSDILAAAEKIQEVAWTLREAGAAVAECDAIDQQAVNIYTACSFQDLTAQRTRKVIETLGFIEKRIHAMADIWQFAGDNDDDESTRADSNSGVATDPAMSQADVDFVLVESTLERADFDLNLSNPAQSHPVDSMGTDFDLDMAHPLKQPQPAAGDLAAIEMDIEPLAAVDDVDFQQAVFDAAANDAGLVEDASLSSAALTEKAAVSAIGFGADVGMTVTLPASPAVDQVLARGETRDALSAADIGTDSAIDEILFTSPEDIHQQPVTGAVQPHLQLVPAGGAVAAPDVDGVFARAREGQALTAEEAAAALDKLKAMSVEDRTKLFV